MCFWCWYCYLVEFVVVFLRVCVKMIGVQQVWVVVIGVVWGFGVIRVNILEVVVLIVLGFRLFWWLIGLLFLFCFFRDVWLLCKFFFWIQGYFIQCCDCCMYMSVDFGCGQVLRCKEVMEGFVFCCCNVGDFLYFQCCMYVVVFVLLYVQFEI